MKLNKFINEIYIIAYSQSDIVLAFMLILITNITGHQ